MNHIPNDSLWIPAASEKYELLTVFTLAERLMIMIAVIFVFIRLYKQIKIISTTALDSPDSNPFITEQYASFSKRFFIILATGAPLYLLSAFEPLLILEIDLISVLISVLYLIWIISSIFVLSDAYRQFYGSFITDVESEYSA